MDNAGKITKEDAISREYLFKVLDDFCGHDRTATITLDTLADLVYDMPSVTQKSDNKYRKEAKRWKNKWLKAQKTGHWIEIAQYSDGNHKIECSECESHIFDRGHANSFNVKNKYKYCPNCGARMVEPQERSE